MGNGWNDSRISYPYDRIAVTPNIYVINTELCSTDELWNLLYNNRGKSKKDPLEMMGYLLQFKPSARELNRKKSGRSYSFYSPSLENFVLSINHNKYLECSEDVAEKIAVAFYDQIRDTRLECYEALKEIKSILR